MRFPNQFPHQIPKNSEIKSDSIIQTTGYNSRPTYRLTA
jgi:hypothetical protein